MFSDRLFRIWSSGTRALCWNPKLSASPDTAGNTLVHGKGNDESHGRPRSPEKTPIPLARVDLRLFASPDMKHVSDVTNSFLLLVARQLIRLMSGSVPLHSALQNDRNGLVVGQTTAGWEINLPNFYVGSQNRRGATQ